MATFVLISGAWHGSWCWSEVEPLLRRAGHRVITADMLTTVAIEIEAPRSPIATAAERIADVIRGEREPVVLVGHSRGGLIISAVAERVPTRVARMIYLCAFMVPDGHTLQQVAQSAPNAQDFSSALSLDGNGWLTVNYKDVRSLFYNRTPDRLADIARSRLSAEPASSFQEAAHSTQARAGSVPRAYIECTDDRAIPLATQREMQAMLPCDPVVTLDSDHSPFFSQPAALVQALTACLGEI